MKTVAVLGGGVGGLSAAHELAERGFKVKVYEHRDAFGGKARSLPVPRSGKAGRIRISRPSMASVSSRAFISTSTTRCVASRTGRGRFTTTSKRRS